MDRRLKRYRKIGNLHCYSLCNRENPEFCIGPHWPFFACMLTAILLIASSLFTYTIPKLSELSTFLGVLCYSFLLICYLLAAILNPGIAISSYLPLEPEIPNQNYCAICHINGPAGAEHCDECDVCILQLDHHCPWTSKCIGEGNIRFFYGSLIGFLACFVYSVASLGLSAHDNKS